MKKRFLKIAIFATVLAVQPLLLSSSTLAQTYNPGTYNGGTYNDSRTGSDTGSESPSGLGESPSSGGPSDSGQTSDTTAEIGEGTGETTDSNDENALDNDGGSSDTANPTNESTENTLLRWISIGAVGLGLLFITVKHTCFFQ